MRNEYKILVGKPKGKRLLGRPRSRVEDIVQFYIEEIGLEAVNWIILAQDRDWRRAVVNAEINLMFP
jgi:hypothetical protein